MDALAMAEGAYLAYGAVTDFKNFRGDPMPEFSDLPEPIRRAWVAAVKYVANHDSTHDTCI